MVLHLTLTNHNYHCPVESPIAGLGSGITLWVRVSVRGRVMVKARVRARARAKAPKPNPNLYYPSPNIDSRAAVDAR